eukprot:Blabericola_migrator_1__10627@NODE_604_length_7387_cov_1798_136749_g298_i2_p1_GENE_NODE_604_length_7387_cov_1798_136749_g298_i2NODE_604_length_7387_cov_1798_136749_g298_i2_p1_ORF_typecomplete_len1236_score229_98E1E2_ATPase/PF00122_20/5_9e42E1E2_ATPase/PF00122_20/1_4e04E1E2_ATPase/PF00122_20/1_6e03Hydrolase/PF00702_26/1_2e38Cation_ATPase_C/PF00689_21/7e02Cation_ATPase_C/PF00689_21/1_1e27Cation_ATPase_N/PF00690_26/4_3e11Hydrolase_3/PF08282_12/3e07Cation_ATPase/PF13246_6/1_2e05HAD/PF12710_7/0_00012
MATPGVIPPLSGQSNTTLRAKGGRLDVRRYTRRVVSNRTLPARPTDLLAYPEDETRATLGQIATVQFSVEDLVAQTRATAPEQFKNAISKVAITIGEIDTPAEGLMKWSTLPLTNVESQLSTNANLGLTESQITINREQYGYNVIAKPTHQRWWEFVLDDLKSPLVVFLLIGCSVSLAFHDWTEAGAILILIVLNSLSSAALQSSASARLQALANLNTPTCEVIRSGKRVAIEASDLVVGDVVVLTSGMAVPADIRLTDCQDLTTNESLLTGESEDIEKVVVLPSVTSEEVLDELASFPANICYQSTLITNGSGKGICIAVGMDTQLGKIAESLVTGHAAQGSKRTPLEVALSKLGGVIGICVVVILTVIILAAWFTGYTNPTQPERSRVVTIVALAVGFAVSAMPESLPTVVTSCFAMGCETLRRQNAQVRRLPAVETLGCTSVICTDKTGTLTQAKMVAEGLVLLLNHHIVRMGFYPLEGFSPLGGIVLEEDLKDEKHLPKLARRLKRESLPERFLSRKDSKDFDSTTGVMDPLAFIRRTQTPLKREMSIEAFVNNIANFSNPKELSPEGKAVRFAMLIAKLCTLHTQVDYDAEKKDYVARGNATDAALVVGAAKARWSDLTGHVNPFAFCQIDEQVSVPFNSKRKIQYSIFQPTQSLNIELGPQVAAIGAVKGAPERVLSLSSSSIRGTNGRGPLSIDVMTPSDREQVMQQNVYDSGRAMRVLALAVCLLNSHTLAALLRCDDSDERLEILLQQPLIFIGLVSNLDPPKPLIKQALKECNSAQVRVVVITGDQVSTALGVANILELPDAQATLCTELTRLETEDADQYKARVEAITAKYNIFCRARPEDKLCIVESLQRHGHVVAMTGDGVNDAPALHTADIGVAMGVTGTDVAKGAADLILLDDNFATIVTAIREGRRIFANCQKFISYLIGTDFGEVAYLTIAILTHLVLPLDALQVLYVNLICDAPPAISLAKEPAEDNVMQKHPRDRGQSILTREYWLYAIIPHVISVTIIVITATLVFTYWNTGVWTSKAISNQCLESDDVRYYCQTSQYLIHTGWVTSIDHYDGDELKQYYGIIPGRHTQGWLTPQDVGLDSSTFTCAERDALGWCYGPHTETPDDGYVRVNTRAARIVSTMTFTMAAFSEILWPYSLRSWLPFYTVFNRSPWLHIGAALPAVLTLVVPLIPYIRQQLGLHPIDLPRLTISLACAILVNAIDEAIPKAVHAWRHGH